MDACHRIGVESERHDAPVGFVPELARGTEPHPAAAVLRHREDLRTIHGEIGLQPKFVVCIDVGEATAGRGDPEASATVVMDVLSVTDDGNDPVVLVGNQVTIADFPKSAAVR